MPETAPTTSSLHRLNTVRRHTARVVWVERAFPHLAYPTILLCAYTLACLLRLPQSLPDGLHTLLELTIIGVALRLIWRGLRHIPRATPEEIDRRIEQASALSHQPLLTLQDSPASTHHSAAEETLWTQHVQRTVARIGPLRSGWPVLTPHPRTKWGVLGLASLLLLSLAASGTHAPSRLWAGWIPGQDDADAPLPTLQAWIDLPTYAPGAPLFLTTDQAPSTSLAEGSTLTAVVSHAEGTPHIHGAPLTSLQKLDAHSWRLQASLTTTHLLRLTVRGRTISTWPITIAPNPAPKVLWNGKPGPFHDPASNTPSWRTALPWSVEQPYGVKSLEATISAPNGHGPIRHVHIPLNRHPLSAKGIAQPDLSDDPLAGTDVVGTLHAVSVSGKTGQSETLHFHLGSRHFTDPLARAITALRVRLLLQQETPQDAAQELLLLTDATKARPLLSTLALLAARVPTDTAPANLAPITEALWDFALYLEDLKTTDPATADAAAAVRAAETAVRQHIEDMAKHDSDMASLTEQQTLHDLTETLKQALTHRLALLFQHAAQSGIIMPSSGANEHDPFSGPIEQLRSQATQGQTESALQTLQDMEDMAEHMRQAGPQDMQALAHSMQAQEEARMERSALRDLIRRETELLDHAQLRLSAARKAAQPMDDDAQPDVSQMSTDDLLKQLGMQSAPTHTPAQPTPQAPLDETTVREQAPQRRDDHALQRALTQLDTVIAQRTQSNTGKKVDAFDKAKTDMMAARHALAERHDPEAAIAEQKVLDDLKQANQQMQKNQKSSSGQGQGSLSFIPPAGQSHGQSSSNHGASQSQNGDQNSPSDDDNDDDDDSNSGSPSHNGKGGTPADKDQDPLGRDMGEGHNGQDSDAHIPDQNTRDRARDIERELRRRAADRTRPQSELDYLQRLLKSF
ncbi:DUF4175 family protein [Neokomagataea anthophila]|uniref:DUF4175 family protein n=1 Tax=Neokomagataea anthophila TaxID=2826925 RepID=A0ABS5E414_9PROT|nr:DUF4175 family protein [Neokomagataea anthophila]MBR0558606.1 DUF4175 family protein [Neokomagataea anthophila]